MLQPTTHAETGTKGAERISGLRLLAVETTESPVMRL